MGPPGHLGVGFAAKRIAPKAPLWALLVATEMLDLLCFAFMALGIERMAVTTTNIRQGMTIVTPGTVPWSHGLLMSIVWSTVVAGIAHFVFRDRRTSIVIGLVVFSHWVLDLIVHLPDLPIFLKGSPLLGLRLWGSGLGLIISVILEIGLLAVGIALYQTYRKRTAARATA